MYFFQFSALAINITLKPGWQVLSNTDYQLIKGFTEVSVFQAKAQVPIVWSYENNQWCLYRNESGDTFTGISQCTNNTNDVWLFLFSNQDVNVCTGEPEVYFTAAKTVVGVGDTNNKIFSDNLVSFKECVNGKWVVPSEVTSYEQLEFCNLTGNDSTAGSDGFFTPITISASNYYDSKDKTVNDFKFSGLTSLDSATCSGKVYTQKSSNQCQTRVFDNDMATWTNASDWYCTNIISPPTNIISPPDAD